MLCVLYIQYVFHPRLLRCDELQDGQTAKKMTGNNNCANVESSWIFPCLVFPCCILVSRISQVANIKSDEGLSCMGIIYAWFLCDVCLYWYVHIVFTCLRIVEVVVDFSFWAGKQMFWCTSLVAKQLQEWPFATLTRMEFRSILLPQEVRLYSAHCGVRLPAGCVFQHQGEEAEEHHLTATVCHT